MLLVFLKVGLQQFLVRFSAYAAQHLVVFLSGVAAQVLIVHEVRGCHNEEGDFCGVVNLEFIAIDLHFAVGFDLHATIGSQTTTNAFLLHILHCGIDLVQIRLLSRDGQGGHFCLQGTLEGDI